MSKKEKQPLVKQPVRQHDWESFKEDENKVYCVNCGIIVHRNTARRGVGSCSGNPVKDGKPEEVKPEEVKLHELSPEDIRANLPKMQKFVPSGDEHGNCHGCGEKLREFPFNRRLGMIACGNSKCNLYRQRIRWFTIKPKSEEAKI